MTLNRCTRRISAHLQDDLLFHLLKFKLNLAVFEFGGHRSRVNEKL